MSKRQSKNIVSRVLRSLWRKGLWKDSFPEDFDKDPKKRKLLSDLTYQLQRAGVVEEVSRSKQGKRINKEFKLTEKGMMRAVKLCMEKDKLKKLANERRLIIFDIPEKRRFYRDYFRQLMKDLGCQMIQLSVWQADFELPEDFLILVGELGLRRRVIVYKVKPDEILYL